MKCDICGSGIGVSVVHGVLKEAESAGVRRLCAKCNMIAARKVRALGLFTLEDTLENDRRRKFVEILREMKSDQKVKS